MIEVRKCKNQELLSSQTQFPSSVCVYIYMSFYIYLAKFCISLQLEKFFLKRQTSVCLSPAEADGVGTLTGALAKCRGQLELRAKLGVFNSMSSQLSNGDKNTA